jgi:hypothetical protein
MSEGLMMAKKLTITVGSTASSAPADQAASDPAPSQVAHSNHGAIAADEAH